MTRIRTSFVTDSLVDQFVAMYEAGDTTTDIGKKLRVNNTTVRKYLIKRGVTIRGSNDYIKVPESVIQQFIDLYKEGFSSVEIGKQLKYSKPVVLKYLRERGVEMRESSDYSSVTQDTKEEMVKLYTSGLSCSDISEKLNTVSAEMVRRYLLTQGVEMRPVGGGYGKLPDTVVDQMVALYESGSSTVEIATDLDIGVTTVNVNLKERGVKIRPSGWKSRKLTDTQEQEAIHLYLSGIPAYKIADTFGGIEKGVILHLLEKHGITRREREEANRVYTLNPHVFDNIDNELAAYWLGFIYADGYVTQGRSLVITLSEKDKAHLDKLPAFLETSMPVMTSNNGPIYRSATISAHNQHIASTLITLGITPHRPDFTLAWNKVPTHLKHHFLRGLFDGDGTAKLHPSLGFMGQSHMMEIIRDWLAQVIGTNPNLKVVKHTISDIYYLSYVGGKNARIVADYLYKDATVWLERKRNRINAWPVPEARTRNSLGRYE